MKPLPYYCLFEDIWEYLDFRRHKYEASRISPDGLLKATLKQHGSWFSYSISAGENAEICTTVDIFRATAVRLRAFNTGCAKIALLMKRYLRTKDRKWLKVDRPYGALHGGIPTTEGGYMWRGTKDNIDTDEWIDLVEDEKLARLLHQVDQMLDNASDSPNKQEKKERAWKLLESVPQYHQYHVEVLRRRLQRFSLTDGFKDHTSTVRWARKLLEAEPYDIINWLSLEESVESLEGKAAAVQVLREGLERYGPDFTLYYGLAAHLCALDRLDEAKEAMLLAVQEDIFALKGSLESDTFTPIHEYIRDLKESDWYKTEKMNLEELYPQEKLDLLLI